MSDDTTNSPIIPDEMGEKEREGAGSEGTMPTEETATE